MYFVPILLALAIALIYPSLLLAGGVALIAALYLRYGGQRVDRDAISNIRGQLAYRVLSIKLMALNGRTNDDTNYVHFQLMPDEIENCDLRANLRDAANAQPDGWRDAARTVYASYRNSREELGKRLDGLIIQMNAQPDGVTEIGQSRLIDIARMWSIGPKSTREMLAANNVAPSQEMLAWR